MKNIYKSYSFWTALSGAVVVLLQSLGKCFGFTIDDEIVSGVIMAIAGLLVVLGVVTMPKEEEKIAKKQSELDKQSEQKQTEENNQEQKGESEE